MSQRPRRFTSSRSVIAQKRKAIAASDSLEEDTGTIAIGKNWFFQQTPKSQVYYLKVFVGLITGIIGLFYGVPIIANNWFIFPLISLAGVYIIVRNYLNISKDEISDVLVLLWHGTISMIIGFIVTSALLFMIISPPKFLP